MLLFDFEPNQRYEAYERKEEERRDLASDYLQVLSKSLFKHANSLDNPLYDNDNNNPLNDNPLNDRPPWVPPSLKFLWTAQTQDQMIRWLSWQMPSKSEFSCSWQKNSWKVSFHTSINRTTSALLKWDFMLLKKCLKKWDFMLLNDELSITNSYLLHTCPWHTTQLLKESDCKNKRRICQERWSANTKQRFHWNVRNSRSGGSGGEAEEEKNEEQRSREHRELAGRERGEGEGDEDEDVGEFVLKSQPLLGGSGREGGDVKSKKTKTFQDPSKKRLLWDKAKLSPRGVGF